MHYDLLHLIQCDRHILEGLQRRLPIRIQSLYFHVIGPGTCAGNGQVVVANGRRNQFQGFSWVNCFIGSFRLVIFQIYSAIAWIIHEISSQERKDALKG
jgi:hypothetical protein